MVLSFTDSSINGIYYCRGRNIICLLPLWSHIEAGDSKNIVFYLSLALSATGLLGFGDQFLPLDNGFVVRYTRLANFTGNEEISFIR